MIEPGTLSDDYEITAWSELPEGGQEIMAVQHKRWPVYGLQFHPESFLTIVGADILRRFLELRPMTEPAMSSAGASAATDQHRARRNIRRTFKRSILRLSRLRNSGAR